MRRPVSVARGVGWALATLITVQLAATAGAQDRSRARQLYAQAQQLFDSGNFAAAETSFRAAYNASPNPVVLRAIAAAQERQGNLRAAATTLQQYLRDSPGATDRAEVEARLREFNARPGTLAVSSVPPGAQIILDNRDTGQRTPAQISAAAGAHTLMLRLNGYSETSQQIEVQASTSMRLDVRLQPGTGIVQGPSVGSGGGGSSDPSAEVWIFAGVAVAGLAAGTILGFLALNDQSNYDAMPAQGTADEGRLFALFCDISFGVALAAGITSILLYILERPSGARGARLNEPDRLRVDIAPWAAPTGAGLAGLLRF